MPRDDLHEDEDELEDDDRDEDEDDLEDEDEDADDDYPEDADEPEPAAAAPPPPPPQAPEPLSHRIPAKASHWEIFRAQANKREGASLTFGTDNEGASVYMFPVADFSSKVVRNRWGAGDYLVRWVERSPTGQRLLGQPHRLSLPAAPAHALAPTPPQELAPRAPRPRRHALPTVTVAPPGGNLDRVPIRSDWAAVLTIQEHDDARYMHLQETFERRLQIEVQRISAQNDLALAMQREHYRALRSLDREREETQTVRELREQLARLERRQLAQETDEDEDDDDALEEGPSALAPTPGAQLATGPGAPPWLVQLYLGLSPDTRSAVESWIGKEGIPKVIELAKQYAPMLAGAAR